MTSKNPAYCLPVWHISRVGEVGYRHIYRRHIFYCTSWVWRAGRQAQRTCWCSCNSPQRWHRGPVKTVLGCFSFPVTGFPHTDAASCVHQRGPAKPTTVGGRLAFCFIFSSLSFFLNTTWALSFAFLSLDEIWPMLADTKGQWEHVHYKSNYLERFPIRPQKTGFIHVSSGLQKSIKFIFRFRSSGKFLLEICLTAQWKPPSINA